MGNEHSVNCFEHFLDNWTVGFRMILAYTHIDLHPPCLACEADLIFICGDQDRIFLLNYFALVRICCLNCLDSCMKCLDPGFKAEIASVPFDFADSYYSYFLFQQSIKHFFVNRLALRMLHFAIKPYLIMNRCMNSFL